MTIEQNFSTAAAVKKFAVKVIGLGGAGVHITDYMLQTELRELAFVAVHSDARALDSSRAPNKHLLGAKLMRGLGAAGDVDLGRAAAQEELAGLKAICEQADLIFIVAGLGGGTATGAAPVLARAARESGALVLALVSTPFEFEGARRRQRARVGLQHLKAAADGVLCLPLQKLSGLLDEQASALDAFRLANDLLAEGIAGIWRILTRFGLLNVDFADLCSVARGRHLESAFACAQAEGEDRARAVIDKLFASPLLDEGQLLPEAETILVNLIGGPDLTMTEVSEVMQRINQRADKAHAIVGAAIDDEFRGRLGVTLVVARRTQPGRSDSLVRSGSSDDSASELEDPAGENEDPFLGASALARPASRFGPPPPELSPEQTKRLLTQRAGSSVRRRKVVSLWSQGLLPLDVVTKGRFEKSEPTIHQGEDLDIPTYIRRGMALN